MSAAKIVLDVTLMPNYISFFFSIVCLSIPFLRGISLALYFKLHTLPSNPSNSLRVRENTVLLTPSSPVEPTSGWRFREAGQITGRIKCISLSNIRSWVCQWFVRLTVQYIGTGSTVEEPEYNSDGERESTKFENSPILNVVWQLAWQGNYCRIIIKIPNLVARFSLHRAVPSLADLPNSHIVTRTSFL